MENNTSVINSSPTVQLPNATSSEPISNIIYANLWGRMAAWFIDFVLWFGLVGYILALLTNQTTSNGFMLEGSSAVLLILIGFAYFVLSEAFWGATLGKSILKLKVVKDDQSKIGFREAVIRNLARLIDLLPFLYIVGAISIFSSSKKQRVGDKIAHTVVVKK